jgi:hypothetical protein
MIFSIDFFSSPDPNGQVSYCHHLASDIRRSSVNFKKIFSSETTGRFLSYYPKTAILPLCSIYRHGGHDGWSAGSSDIIFKGNPLMMIQAKFGLNKL